MMLIFVILGVILLGSRRRAARPGLVGLAHAATPDDRPDRVVRLLRRGRPASRAARSSSAQTQGFAAPARRLIQSVLGVGEHGIRRELLAAGMYDDRSADDRRLPRARRGRPVGALDLGRRRPRRVVPHSLVLGAVALGVLGWMLPVTIIKRRGRQRTEQIDYELPELIDLLVVTLEAGLSFLASLHMAAERLEGRSASSFASRSRSSGWA